MKKRTKAGVYENDGWAVRANTMIRVIVLEGPDSLDVDSIVRRLQDSLIEENEAPQATPDEETVLPARARNVHPNKQLVEALKHRVRLAGVEILTRNVVNASGVHETEFFKWQGGRSVGKNTRNRCKATVRLAASEFPRRMNAPVR